MKVSIKNLGKTYPGGIRALDDINLELANGMFGLLGPNGAGKTTLMRILATLLPPSRGDAIVGGFSVLKQPQEIRKLLGYLPQGYNLYPQLTVWETLDYLALLSGLDKGRSKQIAQVLELVNLTDKKKMRTGKLSGGMKQRLGIAQALLNNPRILIVDEPTAGLDPEERVRFRNLLSNVSQDRIVILSTHIVEDIANTCNDLAIIHQSHILFRGSPIDLIDAAKGKVWTVTVPPEQRDQIRERYHITSSVMTTDGWQFRLLSNDAHVPHAIPAHPTIEDGYMVLMQLGAER